MGDLESISPPTLLTTALSPCCIPPNNNVQAKLNEYEFPVKKVANVQSQLSRLIEKNYYLNKSAREVRKGEIYTVWIERGTKDIPAAGRGEARDFFFSFWGWGLAIVQRQRL